MANTFYGIFRCNSFFQDAASNFLPFFLRRSARLLSHRLQTVAHCSGGIHFFTRSLPLHLGFWASLRPPEAGHTRGRLAGLSSNALSKVIIFVFMVSPHSLRIALRIRILETIDHAPFGINFAALDDRFSHGRRLVCNHSDNITCDLRLPRRAGVKLHVVGPLRPRHQPSCGKSGTVCLNAWGALNPKCPPTMNQSACFARFLNVTEAAVRESVEKEVVPRIRNVTGANGVSSLCIIACIISTAHFAQTYP
jgi:hypothetical protein